MGLFSWLWISWAVLFVGIEGAALVTGRGKASGDVRPRTLSAQIWWMVRGQGKWHQVARAALVAGLAWLTKHLLG